MKRVVKYIAIYPYYSNIEQTYIGSTPEEIDNIQNETEEHMAQFHYNLSTIYKKEIVFDDTFEDFGTNVVNNKDKEKIEIIL